MTFETLQYLTDVERTVVSEPPKNPGTVTYSETAEKIRNHPNGSWTHDHV